MHKLTLAMIVKNENVPHFKECLESVAPYIDYYVIADNGSTDGTQEFIKEFFDAKGIEGEVHNVPWVDFGYNRTEVIEMCNGKTEYIFMIDADDHIVGTLDLDMDKIIEQGWQGHGLRISRGDFTWWRNQIFKADAQWCYKGVLHEYAFCKAEQPHNFGRIDGEYHIDARTLGARNKNHETGEGIEGIEKYSKDADVLLSALTNPEDPSYEPDNSRYQFYLAQSYFDSQQWEKAEEAYAGRANMGGWKEEVFYSVFRVAICKLLQDKPWPEAQDTMLQAWNIKPDRAEPLYQIAKVHRMNGNSNLCYMFAKMATEIPYPKDDILFISDDVYKWKILDEFAASAYYMGDFHNGYTASKLLVELLEKGEIPEENRQRFYDNIMYYESAIKEENSKREEFMKQKSELEEVERQKKLSQKRSLQNKKNKKKKKKSKV
jgi:glycosyltransferase involved in cell wall biosynthesis